MVFLYVVIVFCKVSICWFWIFIVVWYFDNLVFKVFIFFLRVLFWFWRVFILCVFKMDFFLYLLVLFWFCNIFCCNLEIVFLVFLSFLWRLLSCCLKDFFCLIMVWICILYLLIVKFFVFFVIFDCLWYLL